MKIKKKTFTVSVLVALLLVVSLIAVFTPKAEGKPGYDNCDTAEVAAKCCKVADSRNQCNNYCKVRGSACGWNKESVGSCKVDVGSTCNNAMY
ncbi:MAG: hypothetical protein ABIG28_01845 [archaeon]